MALVLSRPGAVTDFGTTGTDTNELFLEQFTGEIIATFEETNLLMGLTRVMSISEGKSAIFPALGTAQTRYLSAGESLLTDQDALSQDYLSDILGGEKEIFIDDPLTASCLVWDLDKKKNHWDTMSQYSALLGRSLSLQADLNLYGTLLACSLSDTTIGGGKPFGKTGSTVTGDGRIYGPSSAASAGPFPDGYGGGVSAATDATNADQILDFIRHAMEVMDDNNVPAEERYCLLRPASYYSLVDGSSNVINSDYTDGSNGGLNSGKVISVMGCKIVKAVNMPSTNTTNATGFQVPVKNDMFGSVGTTANKFHTTHDWDQYDGYTMPHWATVGGIVFHKSAIGTVKLIDVGLETSRETDRKSDFVVADYAMGHNILRPESCVAWIGATTIA